MMNRRARLLHSQRQRRARRPAAFWWALALMPLLGGCQFLPKIDWPSFKMPWIEETPDFTERCQSTFTNTSTPLPLDGSWLEDAIHCPTSGQSTVGYYADLESPRLVRFRVEVLGGDGALTVRHTDGNGRQFSHLEDSRAPGVEFAFAVTPQTSLLISSPGNVRYRVRSLPDRVVTRPAPAATPAPIPAPPEPETPPPAPVSEERKIAPGYQAAELISRVGDPVRQVRIQGGTSASIFTGQLGRLKFGDTLAGRLCIEDAFTSSATGRLRKPVAESAFSAAEDVYVEIASSTSRPLKLLRNSGDPIAEVELRGGSRSCLKKGMRGSIRQAGEVVASFRLTRVESSRVWGLLDTPLARERAEGAVYSVDLNPDTD